MPESEIQKPEAWNTALRLATSVGRLRVGSNLKAAADAHSSAFNAAGRACAVIAEGATLQGGPQIGAYREARGALAQCAAWLQILASLINEPPSVFDEEIKAADQAARQLAAASRAAERGPGGPPRTDGPRGGNAQQGRGPGPPRQGSRR